MPADLVTVVGVGADGWNGLSPAARAAVESAEVLMGSPRQLALVPPDLGVADDSGDVGAASPTDVPSEVVGRVRVAWPSPLSEALPGLLQEHRGRRICVLASGDPTFHGIGTTLTRLLGARRRTGHPTPVERVVGLCSAGLARRTRCR